MNNLIFPLSNDEPKYKQIYQQIKMFIEQGNLQFNDPLPSIRRLADTLHVSRNTTLTAYEQLVAEGYIRGERRKGFYVNALEQVFLQAEVITSQQIKKRNESIRVDFRSGTVNQQHFPLKIWRQFANQTLQMKSSFVYGDPFGEPLLQEQIAQYLFQARGVKVNEENIIIGSSTQQMLVYLGFLLKQDFNSIIVEEPGYNGAREAFHLHHFQQETLPVSENGAQLDLLAHLQSRLIYVTPSHHFPYGVSMSIQQRQTLIHWAKQVDGFVIEDDYDSEFRYSQQPFPALASLDQTRVIYVGTFSKSFLPGIRLSYMVLPKALIYRYKQHFAHFEQNASSLHQLTMAKFMEKGECTRHIKRMRIIYKQKMQYLVAELNKQFHEKITIIGEQSGLYVLVKFHTHHSEEWLIQAAEAYGVKVYPTSPYFINESRSEAILQFGFSNLNKHEIQLGLQLLQKAWF
ncbi:PLP-dependent aminotransferase family protein [Lysinibacillus sp. NPDC097287]|uniref:MocR-like pyridoxine biosynthesis transcription factor PdxR n=1 Tax=Lysinibacillus sp. NPDC097287 TaxID=3364144 RepID=UPI0038032ABC